MPYLQLHWLNSLWSSDSIWVRSWNCGCLVTWFCYQLIAKPGNKTTRVSWPDPYRPWYRSISTLDQSMACCLIAASHYLNQCWLEIIIIYKSAILQKMSIIHLEKIIQIKFLKNSMHLPGDNDLITDLRKHVTRIVPVMATRVTCPISDNNLISCPVSTWHLEVCTNMATQKKNHYFNPWWPSWETCMNARTDSH